MAQLLYWDACALVKVFIQNEKNSSLARSYFYSAENLHYTNSFVVYETLGVFKKRFFHKEEEDEKYRNPCEMLFSYIDLNHLGIYEVNIKLPKHLLAARDLRKKYPRLDYSDTIQ